MDGPTSGKCSGTIPGTGKNSFGIFGEFGFPDIFSDFPRPYPERLDFASIIMGKLLLGPHKKTFFRRPLPIGHRDRARDRARDRDRARARPGPGPGRARA